MVGHYGLLPKMILYPQNQGSRIGMGRRPMNQSRVVGMEDGSSSLLIPIAKLKRMPDRRWTGYAELG